MLEDHADILACLPEFSFVHGCQILAINNYLAACRYFQHIDTADQGAFAGTAQTDNTENLTGVDGQIRFMQGVNVTGFAVICFFYIM
ncbi:hypothetical protein SDC9_94684 [bioreactor metagenome]|uniref:Uncharacterized protein n=1 Tax=bioreactor metagenome TaxID=1076179 RepID=A0A645AAV7_9ZZZZ